MGSDLHILFHGVNDGGGGSRAAIVAMGRREGRADVASDWLGVRKRRERGVDQCCQKRLSRAGSTPAAAGATAEAGRQAGAAAGDADILEFTRLGEHFEAEGAGGRDGFHEAHLDRVAEAIAGVRA